MIFTSLFGLLKTEKWLRVGLAISIIVPALTVLYNYAIDVFTGFLFPDVFRQVWNFFGMNFCISVIISAYTTRDIIKLLIKFADIIGSG